MREKILEFKNLSISFHENKKIVKNLSFSLNEKETLALVGESGSGKSITALACMNPVSYTHLTLPTILLV